MSTCSECGGTEWITLLTSKVKCAHPSHGIEMSAWTATGLIPAVDVRRLTADRLNELQQTPLRGFPATAQAAHSPMQPDEVVSGPGYYAKCRGEQLYGTPYADGPWEFRPPGRVLLVAEGWFTSDECLMGVDVDLSKYMPLRGSAIVLESRKEGLAPTVHRFRSNGPILKRIA